MRLHRHALLALPALLAAFVVAVPSPRENEQQPLLQPIQPAWRALSSWAIRSIWSLEGKLRADYDSLPDLSRSQLSPQTHARYGDDVVLRFRASTSEEVKSLAEAVDILLLDVWAFTEDWVDIRLGKDVVSSLLGLLPATLQESHIPLMRERELAQAVADTFPTLKSGDSVTRDRTFSPIIHQTKKADDNVFFNDYQPLSVIKPWMQLLASLFTSHTRLVNIGLSYERREIPALRVGVHPTNNEDRKPEKRKTILITGGSHAREWVTTSTVNYIAYSLITGYGKVSSITRLLEHFDFVFVPTLNPDGYVYSWETDRLWRKNRQPTDVRFCPGMDLDHSFAFEWDGEATAGNPCSESYGGEQPFEAVESKRLADWARNETENNNVEFIGFLDLHSYSQQIMYPYAYSCDDAPPGQENLEELAFGLEKAIRRSSALTYEVMAACEGNVAISNSKKDAKRVVWPRMEGSGGSALDWFYHELHVHYAYQIKLRDRGTYGFLLPSQNIVPTGREMLDAVLYFGQFMIDGYPKLVMDEEEGGIGELQKAERLVDEAQASLAQEVVEDEFVPEERQWDLRRRRRRSDVRLSP